MNGDKDSFLVYEAITELGIFRRAIWRGEAKCDY